MRLQGTILGRENTGGVREQLVAGAALEMCWMYVANPDIDLDIVREAAVRLGAAMLGDRPHVSASEVADPSGMSIKLQFSGQATRNLMRSSGASAMLSPFKIRRAGAIG